MSAKPKQSAEPRRLNRVVGVAEALSRALDPALRKRGFAGRDIITHWTAMAPAPYDKVARPDRLVWPRSERGAEGATLYLRCIPGHALALSHEGQQIAAAVNRYFGYVLVGQVRLSAEPFIPGSAKPAKAPAAASAAVRAQVEQKVDSVADEGVKEALRRLGHAVIGKAKR
jgi:hypothetical protein